jgi:hypothetical protein
MPEKKLNASSAAKPTMTEVGSPAFPVRCCSHHAEERPSQSDKKRKSAVTQEHAGERTFRQQVHEHPWNTGGKRHGDVGLRRSIKTELIYFVLPNLEDGSANGCGHLSCRQRVKLAECIEQRPSLRQRKTYARTEFLLGLTQLGHGTLCAATIAGRLTGLFQRASARFLLSFGKS